jgi:hypothetical protein
MPFACKTAQVALPWDSAKKLMRLQGVSEELLASARGANDPSTNEALRDALDSLAHEIQVVLETGDPVLAAEFERLVVGTSRDSSPPEVQGAAIVGWLRAALGVEALEEKREAAAKSAEPPRPRKQTIGFKIRSPVTRGATPEERN